MWSSDPPLSLICAPVDHLQTPACYWSAATLGPEEFSSDAEDALRPHSEVWAETSRDSASGGGTWTRRGLLIRCAWADGRPIGPRPGRRWGRLWVPEPSSRTRGSLKVCPKPQWGVGGLVARGLSGHEHRLRAFLADAQPALAPAPAGPSPAGLSSPGSHGSPRTRVAELSAGLCGFPSPSSPRAHSSTRGERRLAGSWRL